MCFCLHVIFCYVIFMLKKMQILCFYRICYIIVMLLHRNRYWRPRGWGKGNGYTVPVALIKDKRKNKIRLLDLYVMLTCVCFCYVLFILLSILMQFLCLYHICFTILMLLHRNSYWRSRGRAIWNGYIGWESRRKGRGVNRPRGLGKW